jgi:hypothetical protein
MSRAYRGKIDYVNDETGAFGREYFSVTVFDDGTRTLRCLCEMDHVNLVRDVTYTVNADFKPIDCFVRVVNQGKFVGSGWFRFTDSMAEAEVHTAADGRTRQRHDTPGRVNLFGSHPIAVDIWKCAHTKTDRPGQVQRVDNCMSSSPVENDASGPLLFPKFYDMIYHGPEKVTVASGTYDCERFAWATGTGRTLDLYTVPGDYLPVRTLVPERKRRYELVEFEKLR